jgi:hypothetical protein
MAEGVNMGVGAGAVAAGVVIGKVGTGETAPTGAGVVACGRTVGGTNTGTGGLALQAASSDARQNSTLPKRSERFMVCLRR